MFTFDDDILRDFECRDIQNRPQIKLICINLSINFLENVSNTFFSKNCISYKFLKGQFKFLKSYNYTVPMPEVYRNYWEFLNVFSRNQICEVYQIYTKIKYIYELILHEDFGASHNHIHILRFSAKLAQYLEECRTGEVGSKNLWLKQLKLIKQSIETLKGNK